MMLSLGSFLPNCCRSSVCLIAFLMSLAIVYDTTPVPSCFSFLSSTSPYIQYKQIFDRGVPDRDQGSVSHYSIVLGVWSEWNVPDCAFLVRTAIFCREIVLSFEVTVISEM